MTTAKQFTALGRGNGFAMCLSHQTEAIIASRQVFPSTSGTTAGRQIRLRKNFDSLADAMDVFWNIYDFTIEVKTNMEDFGNQRSLFIARVSGVDDWNDEYGFFPPAGNNPSIIPHLRTGFIGDDVRGRLTESLNIRWQICGGEVTASPLIGAYGLTGDVDFYGDPMPPTPSKEDLPDQTAFFFSPEWYYNTTTLNYCIVFSCSITETILFEGGTQSYTLSAENPNDTYQEVTLKMFDEDYSIYSDDYIASSTSEDNFIQPDGPIVVTVNKFNYN